jgi:Mor family transcriptional regulator
VTYEVYYVARKYGVSSDSVRNVIKRVGNNRKKVYAALKKCRCAS